MKAQALAPAVLAALLLTGCTGETGGTDSEDDGKNPAASSSPPGSSSLTTQECGGLTTEALEEILGAPLEGPEPERGTNDKNGTTWTDSGCDWENDGADLEIDLDIAVASDFPDGTVGCFGLGGSGDIVPVEGIGTQAWWEFGDINEAEGTLTVCTPDALVDFEIDAPSGAYGNEELRDLMITVIRPLVEA
jgi:hypothetical protein